jgi:hypothetical protein
MEMRMTALCQVMPIDWLEAISQLKYRQAWSLLGLLLTPVAVTAGALAAWRFGVDTGWTGTFFIARGFLSHWQVWCAFAISAESCAYILSHALPRAIRATS